MCLWGPERFFSVVRNADYTNAFPGRAVFFCPHRQSEIYNLKSKNMSIENPTLSAPADLAHFRHFRHFRHFKYFIRPGGFSSLFTKVCSTTVENSLQISPFMQNKPNVKYAKININSYMTSKYEKMDNWLFRQNKANSNPIKAKTNTIQSQFKANFSKGQN